MSELKRYVDKRIEELEQHINLLEKLLLDKCTESQQLEQRNKELEKALENMVNYYIESTDPRDRGLEFPYLQQRAEQLLKGGESWS